MKTIFCILMTIFCVAGSADALTVYTNRGSGFALIHTSQPVRLTKGENTIELENLPSSIIINSLRLGNKESGIDVVSQHFKPGITGFSSIIDKAIDSRIRISFSENPTITGILKYYDGKYLGIIEEKTEKFNLLREAQISGISFEEGYRKDEDFTPLVTWKLYSETTRNINLEYSYLADNIGWKTIYQAVWDEDSKILDLASQVELTNNSGKNFISADLKLIAGDIQNTRDGGSNIDMMMPRSDKAAPSYEMPSMSQSTISAFHLYTLSEKVDLVDNTQQQIRLYPSSQVIADDYYYYKSPSYGNNLQKTIAFDNIEKNGIGLPLPAGLIKIYTPDKSDGENQYIGDSRLDNTSVGQKVIIVLGDAFDLSAETKTLKINYADDKRRIQSSDYQITIDNNSKKIAQVIIHHRLDNQLTNIYDADFEYEKIDAYTMEIRLSVDADAQKILKWSQKR
jgi:hypothetical protein